MATNNSDRIAARILTGEPLPAWMEALEHLRVATSRVRTMEHMQRLAVEHARSEGCSWSDVAEMLGCTRQAAQQRFGSSSVKQR